LQAKAGCFIDYSVMAKLDQDRKARANDVGILIEESAGLSVVRDINHQSVAEKTIKLR